MAVNVYNNTSYGLNQPLINTPLLPLQSVREPTANDFAPIGTIWCDGSAGVVYILVNILANKAIWVEAGSALSPTIITRSITTVDATPTALASIVLDPGQAFTWEGTIIASPDTFASNLGGTYQVSVNRAAIGNISAATNPIITIGNTMGGTSAINFVVANPDTLSLVVTGIVGTTIEWETAYSVLSLGV